MANGEDAVLFSVIVPVYMIEYDLLRKCLDSLIDQASTEVEFIVVDDGSPDECGSICDEFAALCPSMRVIHTVNAGVSHARNVGLDNSRGSYVLFVDGDDRLADGFLAHLCKNTTGLADITFFNHQVGEFPDEADSKDSWAVSGTLLPRDLTKAVLTSAPMPSGISRAEVGSPWGKIFRKDFLLQYGCRFPEGVRKTQDRIFMVDVLSHDPKCAYVAVNSYIYIQNNGSITKRYNPKALDLCMETRNAMYNVLASRYAGDDEVDSWFATFVVTIMLETVVDLDIFHKHNPSNILGKYKKFKTAMRVLMPDVDIAEPANAFARRAKAITGMLRGGHVLPTFIALVFYSCFKRRRDEKTLQSKR